MSRFQYKISDQKTFLRALQDNFENLRKKLNGDFREVSEYLDKKRFFFHFLGYENEQEEELARLGKKIYKSQRNLIDFIVNGARKTPLNGTLDKIFNIFSSEKFRELFKDLEDQNPAEDWWYDHGDFLKFCK